MGNDVARVPSTIDNLFELFEVQVSDALLDELVLEGFEDLEARFRDSFHKRVDA